MIIDSRYKVLEEMGRGPWSIVYRVKDVRDGQEYALKLFDGVTSEEFYEHFSPERMHHLMKIRHENLTKIYDFGNFNQHIYYISEFYQGYTLEKFTFTPVSLEILYEIIVKICYGLSALHSQNLVHQLLKPTNIGYKVENGKVEVKIIDYGITKVNFDRQNAESDYLPFLAPEIFQNKQATPESDFFSLGVILYQITTNSKPFSSRNMRQFKENPKLSLIPEFPRQINLSVPLPLENLILQLLDMNPQERFSSAEEITTYINDTQPKKFAFSHIKSEVNKIQLSDYIVREEYSHQLLDYVVPVKKEEGKLIMLYAGKGMGKTDALVLFRYHLLTGEYFIFDYDCSPQKKDPFFALIREFYHSVENNSKLQENMCEISDRMNQYVFQKKDLIDNNIDENLERDFVVASEFLEVLSKERPLIFTIRSCQYMTKEVIDFLNYFSKHYLPSLAILIILSVNDPRRLSGLKHPIEVKIKPLSLEETSSYVSKLLNEVPSEEFIKQLWRRCYGNPAFIENSLIDITSRELIRKQDSQVTEFSFEEYELPEEIISAIYLKMSHLARETYLKLISISIIQVPITHNLLRYVLDISDHELYFLMHDAENNEIIYEESNQIFFTYKEARKRFEDECEEQERIEISRRVISYFGDENLDCTQNAQPLLVPVDGNYDELDQIKTNNLLAYTNNIDIEDEKTISGLMIHASIAKENRKLRLYQKYLSHLYSSRKEFQKAFLTMVEVIKLDLDPDMGQTRQTLRDDIYTMVEFANWIDLHLLPSDFARIVRRMPDSYEKHFLLGAFNYEMERNGRAFVSFQKAISLAKDEYEKIRALLYLGRYYVRVGKFDELEETINQLENKDLEAELMIIFISLKSFHLVSKKHYHEAIKLISEYLHKLAGSTNPGFFVELGGIYVNLGQFYNYERDYKKEADCYHNALDTWRTIGYERKLGIVFNNLGDIALRQGKTVKAFEYFHNARLISEKVNNRTSLILSYLNYGEAYIKQGEFAKAEEHLNQAMRKSQKTDTNKFWDSIIHNIAIARSKQKNFAYYRDFISEYSQDLTQSRFKQITPLVKTWFYYLHHSGCHQKLAEILTESQNTLTAQPEFYWQTMGNLYYDKAKYQEALHAYENSLEYAKRNNSEYAMAIINLQLARINAQISNLAQAKIHEQITRDLCQKNKFAYWLLGIDLVHQQIDLQDETVNLRQVIRNLNNILAQAKAKEYYLIEIECYEILIQIFRSIKKRKQVRLYKKIIQDKLKSTIAGIPETDQQCYLNFHHYSDELLAARHIEISTRSVAGSTNWTENLFELIKIKEPKRVPFLIQKIFNSLFAPHRMALVLRLQMLNKQKPFLLQNIDVETVYNSQYLEEMKRALAENKINQVVINGSNTVFVPLRIKSLQRGCLILSDNGELSFQKYELEMLSFIRLHLTAMLMRGDEFHILNERIMLMNKLIDATGNLFEVVNVKRMKEDITRSAIRMMNAVRGFFITQEGLGNYSFAVAIDESNNILDRFSHIGREVLSRVAANKLPVYVTKDRNTDLVPQMSSGRLHDLEIFAAPILINDETYGYLYLDNANTHNRKLMINREFTPLFLKLMTAMLRNALRYQRLLEIEQKTDQLKTHKEKFIQIVSHELQQPVAVMRSLISTISNFQQSPELDEVMNSFNQTSDEINQRINEIVEHFHFCNMEKLELERFDLREVLQATKQRAENLSESRKLFFALDLPPSPVYAAVDLRVFNILMEKLLRNAIRFSMDLSLTTIGLRSATTLAEKVQDMDSVVIYVKDEGIGIKNSELENIFKEFYEVNDIYSHRSGNVEFNSSGLGLGLATAKKIVELHDGKIWAAANNNGKGTSFFISLPIAEQSANDKI